MASPLSILKTVLNLNHNRMHVTNCETATVTVHRFGETFEQTRIYVHARPYERVQKLCPVCKKKCPGYDTKYSTESSWRAPNLNGVPVYICYQPKRVKCPEHGVRTEYIPWADGGSRFTADFSNEIAWMVCRMSRTAVALFEDIDWRTVGNCVKAAHDRIEPDITARMHGLRRICVDETSYRKGFAYITVVYDMDRNRVVWVHEGNGLETFRLFCEALSLEEREKIEIVAGDGARWIDVCTKAYFPNATRCIDFFHVVEWANEKLDKVRTATAAKASREYDRRKQEFRKAEAKAAETAEAARQKRMAAEAELAAMPKRGRPSKRKQELLDFLASLTETATLDQQRIAAQAELAAMPKHGRPSRRKQELLAFLEGRLEFLPPRISSSKKNGRPRKEQFTSEHQEILDQLQNRARAIKGSKHALGHNPENCSEYQADKIKLIENDYPDLYRAYQLKEALRLILHMKDEKQAAIELEQWITDASGSGLGPMVELSEKIGRHKANILNSVRCQANSAKSEAVNTTIKVLIKMARGFRNIGNMIALIYLKCSDLAIPLHNRPQMSSEKAAAARKTANEWIFRRAETACPEDWKHYILGVVFFLGYYAVIDAVVAMLFGSGLAVSHSIAFIITLNQFIQYMRNAALLFRNASGTFYYDRWKPIAEGVANLVLSLLFVMVFPKEYKVVGVIVATIITNLLICDTVEPLVIFKHVFSQRPGKFYVKNYTYIGLFVVALIGMAFLTTEQANVISSILVNGCISVAVSFSLLAIVAVTDRDFRNEVLTMGCKAVVWVKH